MADLSAQALKSKLSSFGVSVFQDEVHLEPDKTPSNYFLYQRIGRPMNTVAINGNRVALSKSRFQITCVSNTQVGRATLVENVRSLIGNHTDFNAVEGTDMELNDSESKDIWTAKLDLLIWFKE